MASRGVRNYLNAELEKAWKHGFHGRTAPLRTRLGPKTPGGPATSLLGLVPRGVWWRFYDQGEITQQFCGEAVILSSALGEFCALERVLA